MNKELYDYFSTLSIEQLDMIKKNADKIRYEKIADLVVSKLKSIPTTINGKVKQKIIRTKEKITTVSKQQTEKFKSMIATVKESYIEKLKNSKSSVQLKLFEIYQKGIELGTTAKEQMVKIYNAPAALKNKIKDKVALAKYKIITVPKSKVDIFKAKAKRVSNEIKENLQGINDKARLRALNIVSSGLIIGTTLKNQVIKMHDAKETLKNKIKDKVTVTRNRIVNVPKEKIVTFKSNVNKEKEKIKLSVANIGMTLKKQRVKLYNASLIAGFTIGRKMIDIRDKIVNTSKSKVDKFKSNVSKTFDPTPEQRAQLQSEIERVSEQNRILLEQILTPIRHKTM